MIYEFRLPDIGEGVAEGEVVRWLVKEGDVLHEDQPMVEIMTDKATVEIPTPRAGRVARRCFAEGQVCPVGKVLIEIEVPEAAVAAKDEAPTRAVGPAGGPPSVTARPSSPGEKVPAPATDSAAAGPVLATPATRKLARDLGVDIRAVVGTGTAGRITSDDVKAHGGGASSARQPGAAPLRNVGTEVRVPFRGLRKKIAENLVRSKHTAAHFTYVEEIDCTDLVRLRTRANERLALGGGAKLSFLPFIAKATAAALGRFPQLNASLDDAAGEIVQWGHIHLGLATATESGLIVPVVRNADRLSISDMGREIDRLATATRAGKVAREELTGSTFTITSLGALGGVLATPIINHPEVAILGVHRILRRPAVIGEGIAIRDLMNLSISVDHRVVDGYDAARFVADIKAALEDPASLAPELA
jgi:pyruvate dehydrogenase E2 component (dihydrolipoamide acetyltransferase)